MKARLEKIEELTEYRLSISNERGLHIREADLVILWPNERGHTPSIVGVNTTSDREISSEFM